MTTRTATTMTNKDFERLLDVYGADRTRWPLSARASAAMRLANDGGARRLLAEAEALERVLLHAPEPEHGDVAELADRIAAATARAPRLVASADLPVLARAKRPAIATSADRHGWRAGMVLAASLAVGIFAGQTPWAASTVPVFESLTGITLPASGEQLALAEIHVEQADEDRGLD